ncbi:MAG: FAD-dependent oxidoreductase [Acidimicrobiia bacterium]|nr:FAD-dependent oxidoreductase [Acidimicrobiia bacterium]
MIDRLPPQPHEWIDRAQRIQFEFEGRQYSGFAGDTVSTALWANGVRVLGRSFKYHRPRGIWSLSHLDTNAMLETRQQTNIRADVCPIVPGLSVKAVNTVGGVEHDLAAVMDWLSPFLPVGFYYKAFHTPGRLFPFYERRMREMAGLGSVNPDRHLEHTPKRYDFCDVLVVGSGPAGLSAAVAAAESGLQVLLVEENPRLGGSLCYQAANDSEAHKLQAGLLERALSLKNLELRCSTLAAGYYADHWIALIDSTRMTKLRARSLVVAAGCYEQPAVFRNNDLPGVMLASAAQRLIHQYGVRPFREVVVLAANSHGYQAALDFVAAGIRVQALADLRTQGEPSSLAAQVKAAGVPIHNATCVSEATPKRGLRSITGAVLSSVAAQGSIQPGQSLRIACDGIAMSVGWTPADGLLRQGQGRLVYNCEVEQYVPEELPDGVFAAGRVNGIYDLAARLDDGFAAGVEAAAYCGAQVSSSRQRPPRIGPARSHFYPIASHAKGKNFLDLDEDIQLKDIEHAVQEGFDNLELLKRYSTFGMGPSQGKHANLNVLRAFCRLTGQSLDALEMTTARPFVNPVPLSHLAGRIFSPHRQTPLHARHKEAGASFMHAGNWLRPEYYAVAGRTRQEAIAEEVVAVRHRLGLIDVGTLGKLEISGPDAAAFIERIYTGRFARLQPGLTRYVLMCDESGVIIDDGVAARLGEDRFYVTTTTSGSDAVAREMRRWAMVWRMKIVLVNATGTYGAMNLAGPQSRRVLESLTSMDLSAGKFPYLGVREGEIAGVPARLLRVGFVGEWGYEIHVPADTAVWVWDHLMEAGRKFGIRPFGVEAQRVLRLEKAHVIIGQDSDGLTHPFEAGMQWAVKMDKPFFVGQRSLAILAKKRPTRALVGFALPSSYAGPIPKECHLVIESGEIAGRVTSVTFSSTLGQVIGLAYVKPEQSRLGTTIEIRVGRGEMIRAAVVRTPFYDPQNLRQSQEVALQEAS